MNKALEYFDDMVESNQLDYGDEKPKCDLIRKQLLDIKRFKKIEQIGCPLEVRCKITTDTTIYDIEGNSFEISYIHDNNFTAIMNCGFGSNYEFDFAYSDYKITWWLKEDKSE